MVKPTLDINLAAPDIQAFKAKMSEASSHVGTVARQIAKQLLDMNSAIKDTLLASTASMALRMTGQIALVVGSFKLMADAIGAARDQLKDMVDLANKSQNLGVSSSFLQSFRAEAKKLQVDVDDLDGALQHAFNATKDRPPIDLSQWSVGEERITDVEKALRVYNATVAKTAGQQLEGLVLFRDAKTQEDKIQAVLKAMIQLDQIGEKAAALDLGEKMFGSQFVERIRQGRTSAEGMLKTIQTASGDADGIFPDVLVRRAKDMDDELKQAHARLTTALKPSWDDLADVLLTIKGYWADTIGLIAKAVELTNQIKIPGFTSSTDLDAKRSALDTVNNKLNGGWGLYGMFASQGTLEAQRDRLQKEIADLTAKGEQYGPHLPSQSRGAGAAPTKKADASADRFDNAADSIEKRTSALQAEASAIDEGTAARERSKIVAQLETVAKQANVAAGKGENVVTKEQRDRINEVADAYSKAAGEMQKAKIASDIKRGSQTALLDPSDVQIANQLRNIYPDVATALNSVEASALRANEAMRSVAGTMSSTMTTGLADILDGTKSVSAGFADMSKAIVRALEEALIKMLIVAPIMKGLQGALGLGFSGGGIVGGAASSSVGNPAGLGALFADGGYITGPGTARSDSIPARLSNGEFVVNAAATAKHRPVLEAINSDRIPKFADGGLVGGSSLPMIGGGTTIAPTIAVNVQGNPGMSATDHQKMGENIGKAAMAHVKEMIAKELYNQRRPGGLLQGAKR